MFNPAVSYPYDIHTHTHMIYEWRLVREDCVRIGHNEGCGWCRNELFPYERCIFYAVITSIITLDRVSLRSKVVDAPEVLTVIDSIPHLSGSRPQLLLQMPIQGILPGQISPLKLLPDHPPHPPTHTHTHVATRLRLNLIIQVSDHTGNQEQSRNSTSIPPLLMSTPIPTHQPPRGLGLSGVACPLHTGSVHCLQIILQVVFSCLDAVVSCAFKMVETCNE